MLKNSPRLRPRPLVPEESYRCPADRPGGYRGEYARPSRDIFGIAKKIHFLLQLGLRRVGPGHIVEGHFG